MAEVVVFVLSKIGSSLAQEAVSTLSKEVSSVKELPSKVEKIRRELKVMNDVILNRGTNYLDDEDQRQWRGWIEQVRTLAYSAEDVMDNYSYYAHQWAGEGRLKKVIKSSHYVSALRGLCEVIAQIEQDLQHISEQRVRWLCADLLVHPNKPRGAHEHGPQDCLRYFVEDKCLVGMDDKRAELMKWLTSDEKTSMVIIVSGIGGLGKTNLVWNVYESQKKENNFDIYAWIILSQNHNPGDLLRKLIQQINVKGGLANWSASNMDSMSHKELKKEFEEAVKDKRCMVVLDDAWDDEAYKEIHDAFQTLQSASRIIITTRKRDGLAVRALVRHMIEFRPLNYEDAHNLFCSRSSLNVQTCTRGFREVAETVVNKCGKHPLAIISIAKKLSALGNETDWRDTCNELRSELANDHHVLGILHHTYDNLDQDLRNCFLYCSLFPEDYPMRRDSIVRMWVAEVLVTWKEQNTPEMVAERYIRKMIDQNMLQPVEIDEFGEVVTCRVDPILRILALSVSEPVQFGVANDHYRIQPRHDKVRRLSACRPVDKHASNTKCPHLRTLIAVGTYTSVQDKLCWISAESIYIVVLELQDSPLDVVPASIGDLFNLRYLGLRRTQVKSLPKSITKLLNLQTLDLKSTNIEKLPEGIKKLNRLRHLFADKFTDETGLESRFFKGVAGPKWLSCLEELQTLETVEASIELGKQLEKLEQLRSLCIDNVKASHCKYLFTSLLKKRHLSSLLVSASDLKETLRLEDIEPTSMELQKLVIRGCLAEGMLRNFIFPDKKNKVKHLDLASCQFGEDPLQLLANHLPELTCLSLSNVECTRDLVLPEGKFQFLKTLFLKGMTSVQVLTIQDCAIPKVEALYLDTMPNLRKVPDGFKSLRSLKKLWLLGVAAEFKAEWDNEGWRQKLHDIPDIRVEE